MLVVQLFGGDCVVITILRVAPIRSRTVSVALIAFSVLAFVPTLIRVAVLASLISFASSIPCWAVLALFVSWSMLRCCQFSISFNYVSFQFRFTWLSSLSGLRFARCNFNLFQACVVRSFGCSF